MRNRKTRPLLKPVREAAEIEAPRKDMKPGYRNAPLVYLKSGPKKKRYGKERVR